MPEGPVQQIVQPLLPQSGQHPVLPVHTISDHADLRLPVQHGSHHFLDPALAHVDFQALGGVGFIQKRAKRPRKVARSAHRHAQVGRPPILSLIDRVHQVQLFQHVPGMFQKFFAPAGRRHSRARARKDAKAAGLLQVLERLAQIGLTHVQFLGGTRLRTQTRHGDGAAKLMDIHFCSRASRSCIHAFRAG